MEVGCRGYSYRLRATGYAPIPEFWIVTLLSRSDNLVCDRRPKRSWAVEQWRSTTGVRRHPRTDEGPPDVERRTEAFHETINR